MDLDEQRLQRDGYVAAFRDAELHKAIPRERTAASPSIYMEWAGPHSQSVVIPWTVLDGPRRRLHSPPGSRPCRSRAPGSPRSARRSHSRAICSRAQRHQGRAPRDRRVGRRAQQFGRARGARARRAGCRRHRHQRPADHAAWAVDSAFDLTDLDRYYASCVIGGTGRVHGGGQGRGGVRRRHPAQAAARDLRARPCRRLSCRRRARRPATATTAWPARSSGAGTRIACRSRADICHVPLSPPCRRHVFDMTGRGSGVRGSNQPRRQPCLTPN